MSDKDLLPLFHVEVDEDKWKELAQAGTTWGDIQRMYRQPDWCGYPEALEGAMGCWSLIYRNVESESDCKNCDSYNPSHYKGKEQ